MPRLRKKPVVIEAIQLPDTRDIDARMAFDDWAVANGGGVMRYFGPGVKIVTPEGEMTADIGDYIIGRSENHGEHPRPRWRDADRYHGQWWRHNTRGGRDGFRKIRPW